MPTEIHVLRPDGKTVVEVIARDVGGMEALKAAIAAAEAAAKHMREQEERGEERDDA